MSTRRAALVERFRVRARERVAAIRALAEAPSRPEPAAWSEALGALHTVKGDARMLGLASLAHLTHAIEEELHRDETTWPLPRVGPLLAAIDVLDTMLLATELVEDETAASQTAVGIEVLTTGAAAPAPSPALAGTAPTAVIAPTRRREGRTVDVRVAQLDAICDQIDEVRAQLARITASKQVDAGDLGELVSRVERLAADSGELRLGPIEPLFADLAAHARELAAQHGKQVQVTFDAGSSVLERAVLDALAEPLIHLVRNAVDHGLDEARMGRLTLRAAARSGGVVVHVEDDGRGIDPQAVRRAAVSRGLVDRAAADALTDGEAIDLVFRTGLSTRTIASDVSGRGVGLDVVRRVVESMGGTATVASEMGRGTRFDLEVPVGLTRERILVVRSGELLLGLSARHVASVVSLAGAVEDVAGGRAVRLATGLVPLRSAAVAIGGEVGEERFAVVLEIAERPWAIGVDEVLGDREVLRRPADRPLAALGLAVASAVLDDGRAVLLPAPAELIRRSSGRGRAARSHDAPRATRPLRGRRVLVVDDSPIVRELLAELLSAAGLEVAQAEDGEAALTAIGARTFDLVLTDVEMPRLDGFELVRQLRTRGLRIPAVVVTTRGSVEDRRRAAESGADAYVVKTDFREGDLVEVVRGLLEGAS